MTAAGLAIMTVSVTSVTILFGWCLWKVFTTPRRGRLHGFEGEVPDPHRDE